MMIRFYHVPRDIRKTAIKGALAVVLLLWIGDDLEVQERV